MLKKKIIARILSRAIYKGFTVLNPFHVCLLFLFACALTRKLSKQLAALLAIHKEWCYIFFLSTHTKLVLIFV